MLYYHQFPPDDNYFHTHHQNHHLNKQQLKSHTEKTKKRKCGLRRWRTKATLNRTSNEVYTKHHADFIRIQKAISRATVFNTHLTQTEIQSIFQNICLQKSSMI